MRSSSSDSPLSPDLSNALDRMSEPVRAAALRNLSSRRGVLTAGLAVAGTAALAACGTSGTGNKPGPATGGPSGAPQVAPSAPDKSDSEKLVRFSNWPLYIDLDEKDEKKRPSLDAFTTQTGIKVEYVEDINDNVEFFSKLRPQFAAGKDVERDIIVLSDWLASKVIRLGYVQKLDAANMPNAVKNVLPRFKETSWDKGRQYAYPWTQTVTLIAYNEKATDGYVPKSVDDLLTNPRLKGKVALLSEMRETVGMVLLSMGKDPMKVTDDEFKAAVAKIQSAVDKKQIRRFTGNDYIQELASGDIAACLAWSGDLIQLQADSPEVKYVIPDGGYYGGTDECLIPLKAQHKKNAEKLIDYYYQPAVAAQLAAYIAYPPPVVGVKEELAKLDPEAAENPLIMPDEATAAKAHDFRPLAEEEETRYEEMFGKLIGN